MRPNELSEEILRTIQRLDEEVDRLLEGVRLEFIQAVQNIYGKNFGSLEDNRQVANALQETADKLQMVFLCHKCEKPGKLRCNQTKDAPNGSFTISHGQNSTHGGSTKFPAVIPIVMETSTEDVNAVQTSSEQLLAEAAAIQQQAEDLQNAPRRAFIEKAKNAIGRSYGTLEANRRVAATLQQTADTLRMVFRCHKCGEPGRLLCNADPRTPNGSFSIKHKSNTMHGRTKTIPPLEPVLLRDVEQEDRTHGKESER